MQSRRAVILALAWPLWADDLPTFRSDVEYIVVDAQVLAQNHPVPGLKQTDFLIRDNGKPQTVTHFGAEEQLLDIMLLLDVSGSTTPLEWTIKETAAKAMSSLYFRDRMGVAIFFARPLLVIEPTWDRAAVDQAIRRIRWGRPGTELNLSVLNTAIYLGKHSRPEARRALVILTDNVGSAAVPDQHVRDGLWDNNVVLHALLFRTGDMRGNGDVRRFVKATGGETLVVKSGEIPFDEMFRRLRQRYSLMYRAPGGKPGSFHHIEVDLTPAARARAKGVTIRARNGYRGK